MRILMLGNSYTYYHDMPKMLAEYTGAEVVAHTRGGAYLSEQLDPDTPMGASTLQALREEKWDYCILQEYSNGPIADIDGFHQSVSDLCALIRENGAVPVLYATWAYRRDSDWYAASACSYDEMALWLKEAYHEAARANHALVADVGIRFYELADERELYDADGKHPNEEGSRIAAQLLAKTCLNHETGTFAESCPSACQQITNGI